MKMWLRPICIGLLGGFLTALVAFGSLRLTEERFFDRVIYQQWSLYGYVANDISGNLFGADVPWIIGRRLQDMRRLWQHVADEILLPEANNPDLYTVALIGDSFVFGQGILEPERISAVLEQRLNTIRPTKVYTLAQLADDQLEYYAHYRAARQALQPDLYIVSMVWNDFEVIGGKFLPEFEQGILNELRAACPQPIFREPFSPEHNSWLEIIRDHTGQAVSSAYANRCFMNEFIKEIAVNEAVLFFNWQHFGGPDWCEEGDAAEHVAHSFVLDTYENSIREYGGTVIGIDVEDWNNWESVSEMEAHPSKNMHRLGAELLFEELVHNDQWGFAR